MCAGGSIICQALARNHPENCVGIHINMCYAPPTLTSPLHLLQVCLACQHIRVTQSLTSLPTAPL